MSDQKTAIRERMETARRLLLEVIEQLDDDAAMIATENPKWSLRDVLAHLSSAERGLLATIQRFLSGAELPPDFDLNYWNERQVNKRKDRTVAELAADLRASREQAWRLLESLSERDLAVMGQHPAGFRTTVAGIFYTIANHELDHGNEMRKILGMPIVEEANWRAVALPQT
ncbi:MAG: DinB family protein [Chloroflexi bacterium]|nr:DinB family protein [Chloroflexota bacterium]